MEMGKKAVKVVRGVRIYPIKDINPYFRRCPDGSMKEVKSLAEVKVYYSYAGGYPYDTIEECVQGIENVWEAIPEHEREEKIFMEVMNSDE